MNILKKIIIIIIITNSKSIISNLSSNKLHKQKTIDAILIY